MQWPRRCKQLDLGVGSVARFLRVYSATGQIATFFERRPAGSLLAARRRPRRSEFYSTVSVAAALEVENGTVKNARLALGGVAHKPWRAIEAEQVLVGAKADETTFRRAAEAELKDAVPRKYNAFKIELAKRTIVSVLATLARQGGAA